MGTAYSKITVRGSQISSLQQVFISTTARQAKMGTPSNKTSFKGHLMAELQWYLLEVNPGKATTDFHIVTNEQGFSGIFQK